MRRRRTTGRTFLTVPWVLREGLACLARSAALVGLINPRSVRVRRRGFRPDVRRGDTVRWKGGQWNVARRSNWHLWLYEHVPMAPGAAIDVRLPARYDDTFSAGVNRPYGAR